MKLIIQKGDKYNRLTILREVFGKNKRHFECECDCGNIRTIRIDSIVSGNTKGCGCKKPGTHKMCNTRVYRIWAGIKTRCTNKKTSEYKRYGGRGITYAPRWEKFENFYEDMKEGYSDQLTIDRKENHLGYSKDNCRWVTMSIQQRNKRSNRIYKGKCIADIIDENNLDYGKTYCRLSRGWTMEKILELNNKNRDI